MFGREYANHLHILNKSFGEMNKTYKRKLKSGKNNSLLRVLQKIYIQLFGIPEIGFQIRSMYAKYILSTQKFQKSPQKILDAGSGIGTYTIWLASIFPEAQIIGGDIDKEKLKTSNDLKKKLEKKNISFIYFNVLSKQQESVYNLITVIDVLEHVADYKQTLKNFHRLLKKNGYLYIHVPQPNQKRFFQSLKNWYHEDHIHEGIAKDTLEKTLTTIGFKVVVAKETFGFFGKLAWELNHIMLSRNFILSGLTFPLLYVFAKLDIFVSNKNGLGIAVLAQKK